MKITLPVLLSFFTTVQGFGQAQRSLSAYITVQYNHTLYDYTIGNNPWGGGIGLQAFFNNRKKLKPTLEVTADAYLDGDKVLYSNPDGTFPKEGNDVGGMINVFGGLSWHPVPFVYTSFTAGPSIIRGKILPGIKPSLGFYFSKTQRVTGKISYINIFNRTKIVNEDFGSLSIAIGVKLF